MKRFLLAACVALVAVACGPDEGARPRTCAALADCPSGWHCSPGALCIGDVPCAADADCCPAERCEEGACRARVECGAGSPCAAPGRTCEQGLCVAIACGPAGPPCPSPRSCSAGHCVDALPCAGACPAGEACLVARGACISRGLAAAPACPIGSVPVVIDEAALYAEGCASRAAEVSCFALPAVAESGFGRPHATLAGATALFVVAYDRAWGDLVLAAYSRGAGHARQWVRVLDGVPEGAPILGDPSGPRGGVREPGPDVGRSLAAVFDAGGHLHVVARDDTARALVYLRASQSAEVEARITLDTEPNAGRFVAAALDATGRPTFAWFQAGPEGSRLRLARASNTSPAGSDGFEILLLDTTPPPTADPKAPPIARLPAGRGLWPSLAWSEAGYVVSAYDSDARALRIYRGGAGSAPAITTLGGASHPLGSGDMGRFSSLALGHEGAAAVAFEESSRGHLMFALEPSPGAFPALLTVDDGTREDGRRRVGPDVRLVRAGDGSWVLAYQDASRADLVVARVRGAQITRLLVPRKGAVGFSPSLFDLGEGNLLVTSAEAHVLSNGSLRDEIHIEDLLLP